MIRILRESKYDLIKSQYNWYDSIKNHIERNKLRTKEIQKVALKIQNVV